MNEPTILDEIEAEVSRYPFIKEARAAKLKAEAIIKTLEKLERENDRETI